MHRVECDSLQHSRRPAGAVLWSELCQHKRALRPRYPAIVRLFSVCPDAERRLLVSAANLRHLGRRMIVPVALAESASIPPPTRFERVAIFRALQLGDLLCAVPAIRSLRQLWPGSELALIGLPWARELASRFSSYIDAFVEFPGFPGLPEQEPDLERLPEFFAAAQRRPFDLIIQMHGRGNLVNSICALMAPRH